MRRHRIEQIVDVRVDLKTGDHLVLCAHVNERPGTDRAAKGRRVALCSLLVSLRYACVKSMKFSEI